jgi:hypothetical protein
MDGQSTRLIEFQPAGTIAIDHVTPPSDEVWTTAPPVAMHAAVVGHETDAGSPPAEARAVHCPGVPGCPVAVRTAAGRTAVAEAPVSAASTEPIVDMIARTTVNRVTLTMVRVQGLFMGPPPIPRSP